MIRQLITLCMENVPFIMVTTSILLGAIVGLVARKKEVMVVAMIRYMVLLSIGVTGFWAFIGHTLFASQVAVFIGWVSTPFQFEVAVANLGFGFAGLIGFKQKFDFWFAVSIIWTTFLWGAALGHLYQMIFHGNFAPGNIGMTLYMDILRPALLNFLLFYYWKYCCRS